MDRVGVEQVRGSFASMPGAAAAVVLKAAGRLLQTRHDDSPAIIVESKSPETGTGGAILLLHRQKFAVDRRLDENLAAGPLSPRFVRRYWRGACRGSTSFYVDVVCDVHLNGGLRLPCRDSPSCL